MNKAETLPINLSAGDGGLWKKIGFCRACPQVLYLAYLLHFKCTLAGCNRQPSPLSPLRAVSDGKERIPVKEVQSLELTAAPNKEGKTQMKSIAFQKGNNLEYVMYCMVWNIYSWFVPLNAVESFERPEVRKTQNTLVVCLNITETQLCIMKRCIRWLLKCLFMGKAHGFHCLSHKNSVIICAWRLELAIWPFGMLQTIPSGIYNIPNKTTTAQNLCKWQWKKSDLM